MAQSDIYEDLRGAIIGVGGRFQGDGNILFVNLGQISEVIATFARNAVIEQQMRCRDVCVRLAESRDLEHPVEAAVLREAAAQIQELGH
jgi:hypothetical protein